MEPRDRAEPLPSRRFDELSRAIAASLLPMGSLCPSGAVSRRAGHRPKKALAGLGKPIPLNLNFRVRWPLIPGPHQRAERAQRASYAGSPLDGPGGPWYM